MKEIIRLNTSHLHGKNIHVKIVTNDVYKDTGLHWHNYYELIYVEKGDLESTINGTTLNARENTLYMLSLVDFHNTTIKNLDSEIKITNISFAENIVDKQFLTHLNEPYCIKNCNEKIKNIIKVIQESESEPETAHMLNALLCNVIKKENKLNQSKDLIINPSIQHCIRYVSDNFQKPITLKSTAEHLHLSPEYLSYLFSKTCGCTFKEYLIDYRISYAMELLKSTDNSITEICFLSGYSNLSHFLKSFKNIVKKTPSEYRANPF